MSDPYIHEIKQAPNPRLGSGSFPDVALDSYLNADYANESTNINLVLYLRILFVQINASTHGPKIKDIDGNWFDIRNWNASPASPHEWTEYKKRVIDLVDTFWKRPPFVLVTPDHYSGFDWPFRPRTPTHRPNIDCLTRIEEASGSRDAHIKVSVVCLKNVADQTKFRSHMFQYDNYDDIGDDTIPGNLAPGTTSLHQITACHEVGHALGLDHIGKVLKVGSCKMGHCKTADEYGDNPSVGTGVTEDVMGFGMRLSTTDAVPWRKRIALHTRTRAKDWKADYKQQYYNLGPRRLSDIPHKK
jgi:hypothetical protein